MNNVVVLETTAGTVEIDAGAIIGLREVTVRAKNRETSEETELPGCEVLTLGGYQGMCVLGSRAEVRQRIVDGQKHQGSGLVIPTLGIGRGG